MLYLCLVLLCFASGAPGKTLQCIQLSLTLQLFLSICCSDTFYRICICCLSTCTVWFNSCVWNWNSVLLDINTLYTVPLTGKLTHPRVTVLTPVSRVCSGTFRVSICGHGVIVNDHMDFTRSLLVCLHWTFILSCSCY